MSKDDDNERDDAADEAEVDDKPKAESDKAEAKKEEEPKKEEPKAEVKKEEPKPKKEEPKAKKEEPKKTEAKAKPKAREAVSTPPAAAARAAAPAHGHHKPDRRQYLVIFGWLFGLTVLEVGVAFMQSVIGKVALVTALVSLALAKAGCVALFFMHLKHETKGMRWTVALPLLFPALYAFILIAEGIYRSLWGGGA